MRIWVQKSASIQRRTSSEKNDNLEIMYKTETKKFEFCTHPAAQPEVLISPYDNWVQNSNFFVSALHIISRLSFFSELVLLCIEADFCTQIRIFQHFSRSTRFSHFCTASICKNRFKHRSKKLLLQNLLFFS